MEGGKHKYCMNHMMGMVKVFNVDCIIDIIIQLLMSEVKIIYQSNYKVVLEILQLKALNGQNAMIGLISLTYTNIMLSENFT